MSVQTETQAAEDRGELIRPLLCETCNEEKRLLRHHRDYTKPLEITWLCYSCHRKEHNSSEMIGQSDVKLIRIDAETHEIIRMWAIKQSFTKNKVISMGEVFRQYAKRINRKHKLLKGD